MTTYLSILIWPESNTVCVHQVSIQYIFSCYIAYIWWPLLALGGRPLPFVIFPVSRGRTERVARFRQTTNSCSWELLVFLHTVTCNILHGHSFEFQKDLRCHPTSPYLLLANNQQPTQLRIKQTHRSKWNMELDGFHKERCWWRIFAIQPLESKKKRNTVKECFRAVAPFTNMD